MREKIQVVLVFLPFSLTGDSSASPFSDVQRGRAAGASVSTAQQHLAVQRQTKAQYPLTVLLLLLLGCSI